MSAVRTFFTGASLALADPTRKNEQFALHCTTETYGRMRNFHLTRNQRWFGLAFLPGLLNTAIRFVILSAAKNPLGCHVNPRCHPELHLPHWSNLPQLSPRAKRSGVEGNAVAFAFRFPDFPLPRFPDLPTPGWPD
jgi:hypothetical protein